MIGLLMWQMISGVFQSIRLGRDEEEIQKNVSRLNALETAAAAPVQEEAGPMISGGIEGAQGNPGQDGQGTPAPSAQETEPDGFDINSEEEKDRIMNLSGVTNADLYRWFTGRAAIIGDSITHSIWEYEFLDESVVFAKIGLLVVKSDDYVSGAIAASPEAVFFSFGSNDIESYENQVDTFIGNYKPRVQRVKDALPGAKIFILGLLPVTDWADIPAYIYMDDYNAALQDMCRELNVTYLDSGFILERDPDLFDADGIHPLPNFYPKWLTFMADAAGLSDK